jgi:hypothetical protein
MKFHPSQSIVASDNHDYRVVNCGRQWGKTTLAVYEMVACAYAKSGREVAYFATTYDQARNIAWRILKDASRSAWSKEPNESRLELFIKTVDGGESRITLRGFENVETARGQQFDLLVIDEVAQMRNWKYAWEAILEPTLAFRQGKSLFISTPVGFNHFKEMYDYGQDSVNYPAWKSWRFKSEDNPYLPKDRIERARQQNSPDYFAQEYEADFTRATGLAFKMWNRDSNLIPAFDIPDSWNRGRGFDYGSSDPTASLRIAIDNEDNWFVEKCYKEKEQTIRDHANAILSQDYGLSFLPIYGDPSGDQWEKEFKQNNIVIKPANKEVGQGMRGWVEYGVEVINQRLKPLVGHTVELPNGKRIDDAPKLFVLNTPENMMLVSEIEHLMWKTNADGSTMPVLDEGLDPNGHSDLCASLRYFAVSYTKPIKVDYSENVGGVLPFIEGVG